MFTAIDLSDPLDTSGAEAELNAIASRLDLGTAIVTGGEIDLAALHRLQAADRLEAQITDEENNGDPQS